MDEAEYQYVYYCLYVLVGKKKISRNVANKILRQYEENFQPSLVRNF